MEEMINAIATAAGITQEQARRAVEGMFEYMRSAMPESMSMQVEGMMTGDKAAGEIVGRVGNMVGSIGGAVSGSGDAGSAGSSGTSDKSGAA